MLTVARTKSFILFDNKSYRQHDGVAIDFPLAFTFSNMLVSVH